MEKLAITQTQKNQMMSDAGPHVQELLLVMDTDKNGKISKQEWMKFMEAECDRLDENKTGELSPQELVQSKVSVSQRPFAAMGK